MTLTPEQAIEILAQLKDSQCEEFHLETGGDSLTLRRQVAGEPPVAQTPGPAPTPTARPDAVKRASPPPAQAPRDAPPAAADAAPGERISAPMSGVFYRRPSPEEPPFVEVGSVVQAGEPVCIIEVMKLFSTVYAEVSGRVAAIHAADAEAVERDQPLFTIEPEDGH